MSRYLYSPHERTIWDALIREFNNAYAVAGMMGWMRGESNLYPVRCERDYSAPPYAPSSTITQRFDSLGLSERGEFSGDWDGKWIPDSKYAAYWVVDGSRYGGGYGLAQWTESNVYSRKWHMFEYYKEQLRAGAKYSIGSAVFQCKWLIHEMKESYASCYNQLKRCTSVAQGMSIFGRLYEGWGDNTASVVQARIGWGIALYNKYSGGSPVDPPPEPFPPVPEDTPGDGMPVWMMVDYQRR